MKNLTRKMGISVVVILVATIMGCSQSSSIPAGKVKNYDTTIYESANNSEKTLYDEIGGKEVIASIMNDLVDIMSVNPRIAPHFRIEAQNTAIKALLTEQLCVLSGGPCKYSGRSMTDSHKHLKVTDAHFIALVEDAQKAMHKNNLSFETQNKILALLAPMKRVIVTK